MKPAARVATVLLTVVAIAHLVRLVLQLELIAGGTTIPMWVSVVGCVVPAAIAIALWRESRG